MGSLGRASCVFYGDVIHLLAMESRRLMRPCMFVVCTLEMSRFSSTSIFERLLYLLPRMTIVLLRVGVVQFGSHSRFVLFQILDRLIPRSVDLLCFLEMTFTGKYIHVSRSSIISSYWLSSRLYTLHVSWHCIHLLLSGESRNWSYMTAGADCLIGNRLIASKFIPRDLELLHVTISGLSGESYIFDSSRPVLMFLVLFPAVIVCFLTYLCVPTYPVWSTGPLPYLHAISRFGGFVDPSTRTLPLRTYRKRSHLAATYVDIQVQQENIQTHHCKTFFDS